MDSEAITASNVSVVVNLARWIASALEASASLEILSVFSSPAMLTALHGNRELGQDGFQAR